MGKKLKQIKNADLGQFSKNVVDSLLKPIKTQKEEKLEQMRCKIEILEGSVNPKLVDSFIVNINSLDKLTTDIEDKYGENIQYRITNLYDEKIVAKRLMYTGGYDKDKIDKEHFNEQMDRVKKIHKMRDEGKTFEEVRPKFAYLFGNSYIKEVFNSTEEEMKQKLKNKYENQYFGKPGQEILSNGLNTKKDNIVINESEE